MFEYSETDEVVDAALEANRTVEFFTERAHAEEYARRKSLPAYAITHMVGGQYTPYTGMYRVADAQRVVARIKPIADALDASEKCPHFEDGDARTCTQCLERQVERRHKFYADAMKYGVFPQEERG